MLPRLVLSSLIIILSVLFSSSYAVDEKLTESSASKEVMVNKEVSEQGNKVNSSEESTVQLQVKETAFKEHDLSPLGMYKAADAVVKSVLLSLLTASVLVWAIFLLKSYQLAIARKQAKGVLQQLVNAEGFEQAKAKLPVKAESLLLVKACSRELELSAKGNCSESALKERLTARLVRVQESLIANINQGVGVLASVGSVAPFIGLFGTVWGIMNSFIGIAKSQTTNLAVVAPGIAEALLATAIGLVAAIPAVLFYNHLTRAISGYRNLIVDTMSALMILISRDLDLNSPQARPMPELSSTHKQGEQTDGV